MYVKALEKGCDLAKGYLAEMYYKGHYVTKDYSKAFKFAKESSNKENSRSGTSCRILSACYRYGLGTAVDEDEAELWLLFALACDIRIVDLFF